MRNKLTFISVFVLFALLLSACGSAVTGNALAGSVAAQAGDPGRTLTVSGEGQVTLTPDIAYIYMGVHTENASAAEAVAANNTNTQKLLDALKAAGIATNDMRTTNFSIWQNQQYDPQSGKSNGSVYMVDNTVYVTVRDLKNLGKLLDAAVRAGANNVNSITFDLADKTKAMTEARKAAVDTAKKQAAELAAAAGVTLGDLQKVEYYNNTGPIPYAADAKGMGGGGAAQSAVPINPGTMQLTVTVTLTYGLK